MENKTQETGKDALRWLFGGNYEETDVNKFRQIITAFGSLAYLEQEKITEVLEMLRDEDKFTCLDEREVLEGLETAYLQEE